MNKMNIVFKQLENKTIKYNGQRIEINTHIGTIEQMQIVELCLQQFKANSMSLPLIKSIFNIAVVGLQTNVEISEFKKVVEGDNVSINIDINSDKIKQYENTEMFGKILGEIDNYKFAWDLVVKTIELENTKNAFDKVVESLPSETAMNDSLSMISGFLKENPDFAKGLIKEQLKNRAVELGEKEFNDKIQDKKLENIAKRNVEKMIEEEKAKLKNKKK